MKELTVFDINIHGLKAGKQRFDYDIDEKFFMTFEQSDINKSIFHVIVEIEKLTNEMRIDLTATGQAEVTCDRCADPFMLPVQTWRNFIVKFGDRDMEVDEDVYMMNENVPVFNVAQHIYEYLHLALPKRILHPDDKNGKSTCNELLIEKIEALKPGRNKEKDPRWDKLKNLKSQLKKSKL
jgi:uncharacterized metal-binding protein YceD (DUF177 family)